MKDFVDIWIPSFFDIKVIIKTRKMCMVGEHHNKPKVTVISVIKLVSDTTILYRGELNMTMLDKKKRRTVLYKLVYRNREGEGEKGQQARRKKEERCEGRIDHSGGRKEGRKESRQERCL